jgi:hypothetical protein
LYRKIILFFKLFFISPVLFLFTVYLSFFSLSLLIFSPYFHSLFLTHTHTHIYTQAHMHIRRHTNVHTHSLSLNRTDGFLETKNKEGEQREGNKEGENIQRFPSPSGTHAKLLHAPKRWVPLSKRCIES